MITDREQIHKVLLEIQQGFAEGTLTIGGAVKRLRTQVTGMTQEQFSEMCGISARTLGHIEKDEGNPTINTLSSILSLFGLSITIDTKEGDAAGA
ncbi:helix-turn-helix transcriptional regulator [Pseudomonas putida]|uniref:helix-turn-helix domain-containing protein n=1 Tax=Pseudomonas putida TaxID=303 RepID=UPI002FCD7542